ncbi:MAG TPA: C40 family peptidase [Acidimicrobiia bacterium]|jgi:cell wall-associated NlpC family hydrolase|nr:C40 family peptidase [Acidimicrobiia bacterium]
MGLALGLFLPTVALPASASPQNDLAAKTAQAKKLEAQIEADHQRAEILDEQYLNAQQAVADAHAKIAAAEAGIAQAQAQAATMRTRLGNRAATLYMGAGNSDPFQINATDVRELGSRAKYSEAAADQDSRLIDKLRVAEEQLGVQRKDLEKVQKLAAAQQKAADDALSQLKAATATEEQSLSAVKGEIGQLVQQIQREKAAAEERAAKAAAAAAAAQQQAAARTQFSGGGGRSASSADIGVDPGNIPAPSGGASAAVAYARAQIGKPYQYAGTGPGSFDCSGLTMMAWAQGGVSMSHSAEAQYYEFPHVPIAQLQPGDLVVFGNPIHHVGIYVGGGTMIEAPHTGAFVRYATIYRSDLWPNGARP